MKYTDLRQHMANVPIITPTDLLKLDDHFHPVQLTQWQKNGLLQKIRNGYYIFVEHPDSSFLQFAIANKIYGPSYISLESALQYYGLIPEYVFATTSICTRHGTRFQTPRGTYIYKQMKPTLFFGYILQYHGGYHYAMATPEKALLDFLYLHPDMNDNDAFGEWRIHAEEVHRQIDRDRLLMFLRAFSQKRLDERVHLFLNYIDHA